MLNIEIWPLAERVCSALFTLDQVVYSFPFLPSPPLPLFSLVLISFALSMVIYLSDLYLSSTNKLGYHGPPALTPLPPLHTFLSLPPLSFSLSLSSLSLSHSFLLLLLFPGPPGSDGAAAVNYGFLVDSRSGPVVPEE